MDPNYGSHGSKMWIPWIPKIDHIALKYESKRWIQWIQDGNPRDQKCGSSGSHGFKILPQESKNFTLSIKDVNTVYPKSRSGGSKMWIQNMHPMNKKYGSCGSKM